MTGPEATLIERLFDVEQPHLLQDWPDRDGYYVAACRASAEDVPGLIDIVCKWSDPNWPGPGSGLPMDRKGVEYLPVTAWRTLADLRSEAAVQPLIDVLHALEDDLDDWVLEEFPHVFGKIGESSVEPLLRIASDHGAGESLRSMAVRGLAQVAAYHPHTRDRIVAYLTDILAHASEVDWWFNGTLLVSLVDLHAVEAAEVIERAFARNLIDVGMMGNWETVRRKLGVQGLGLTMPKNPHNSISELRLKLGFGIFSEHSILECDNINAAAARSYYERAEAVFSKSREAQQFVARHGDLGWFRMLLQFGLQYRGEIVDQMTLASVKEFVLDFVPRKVSVKAKEAAAILCELTLFWQYLDRVYELSAAKSIVDWLSADGRITELEAALRDSSNFGMAKSLFMLGENAGFDMSSQAGLDEFFTAYNRSMSAVPPPATASSPAANRHVGRNDLCPCGSGKKFKKCCGHPSRRNSVED